MIDQPVLHPEPAYAVLAFVAWFWGFSQVLWFWRHKTPWRFTTMLLMVAKAAFFTFVGSVFWFDWFDPNAHAVAIYSFAAVELVAFLHWLLLPSRGPDALAPLKDS